VNRTFIMRGMSSHN